MTLFEQQCVAYIKGDLHFHASFDAISNMINYSMVRGGLEEVHAKSGFKYYSFSGFRPKKEDIQTKHYKGGGVYEFSIRSFDEAFLEKLAYALRANVDNPHMVVVQTTKRKIKPFFISELYSVTPVIVTCENQIKEQGRYWNLQKNGDIMQLQKQLHANLVKKYNSYFGETLEPTQNFIQLIEIKNKASQDIVIMKKDASGEKHKVTFYGNKFRIVPNEDAISQKLAFTALACGLGEKNSFGGGFCVGKGMR